jgi:hypothetical protein
MILSEDKPFDDGRINQERRRSILPRMASTQKRKNRDCG